MSALHRYAVMDTSNLLAQASCLGETPVSDEYDVADTRFLVLTHISKANNVRHLVQTGAAHGFRSIIVGLPAMDHLFDGDLKELHCIRLPDLPTAKKFLSERCIPLIGIEIADEAQSIDTFPFNDRMAFMPGNEG